MTDLRDIADPITLWTSEYNCKAAPDWLFLFIFEQLHGVFFTYEAQILFLAEEIGSLQQLEYKERHH